MSADGGPGRGGSTLFASPGRGPRSVAFAPAVRGYPGGIADMAGEQDEYVADLSFDESWDPPSEPGLEAGDEAGDEDGDEDEAGAGEAGTTPAVAGSPAPGRAAPTQQAPGRQVPGQQVAGPSTSVQPAAAQPVSVWQQSAAAWQEAGIDWLLPTRTEPRTEPRTGPHAARPVIADDDPRTEPIPVLSTDGSVRPPRAKEPAGPPRADRTTSGAAAAGLPDATSGAPGAAAIDTNGTAAGAAGLDAADTDAPDAAGVRAPGAAGGRTGDAGARRPVAAGGLAADAAAPGGTTRAGGRARRGRRITIVAVAALVLVAGTVAGIGIAGRGGGPAKPGFTLVTPYPAAVAADAELAGRTVGATPQLAALTGIAAAGKTVVAIGAEPSQPATGPLMLYSTDGGHTWARATVTGTGPAPGGGPGAASGATGPGAGAGAAAGSGMAAVAAAAPVLIARSGGAWLALGQHVAWTSPDGKTWRPAPGLPPVTGDTVLGLAGTGTGFVAVGEHTGSQPGPVVWTSSAGRPWQRWTGPARGLTTPGGHVTALRWAAAQGGTVLAGGPVTGATGHGRRPGAGLWRSPDGGRTWEPVKLPVSHGATGGLAGLAASGTGFVAVRPGHAAGRQDALAYLSTQGSIWRYAGKLTPVRRTSLQVTTVSGSSHGFVIAASVRGSGVAFFSARGRGWRQTAAGPGAGVAGLTAGPGGTVVVAGNSLPGSGTTGIRPHLILIGPTGRQQAGQAVLAASATPDVTVNSLAASGRALVAAGAADGAPALWLASAGRWAPAGVLLPPAWRNGALASVVHGGHGWLAIGQASAAPSAQAPVPGAPTASHPVILTSASGTSWVPALTNSPLTAPGARLVQAAAGQAGYVVVGSAPAGGATGGGTPAAGTSATGTPAPVAWHSTNLGTWVRVTLPVPGGYAPGSPQVLAVTAGGPGFVAVGSAGTTPVVWTSRTGSAWRFTTMPHPAGAAGAVLTKVAAAAGRVIAAGYAWRASSAPAGGIPFTVVSPDGGRSWRYSTLPVRPALGVVTALAAAAHGFVAVGHGGSPGRQVMLAWWSSDGMAWQGAAPADGGGRGPFVMQINAVTAGNGTLTGAGFAAGTAAEHPLLWHARYR